MRSATVFLLLTALAGAYAQEPLGFGTNANSAMNLVTLGSNQYLFIIRPASWYDALTFCNAHGMDLVNIETQQENKLLKQHLRTLGLATNLWYNIWTSGTKLGRSRWMWLNGENMDFTDWAKYEPNNPGYEDCVSLFVYGTVVTGWNNAPCEFTKDERFHIHTGFICELRSNPIYNEVPSEY